MKEHNSRRQFLISSSGLIVAAGCGAEETANPENEPIGDPDFYNTSPRNPQGPMDNNMPTCPSTTGLLAGPMASALAVHQGVFVANISNPLGVIWACRDSNGIYGINIRCTHAGCTPDLNPSSHNFVCACHGSTFGFDGALIKGPALRPLQRYAACRSSDGRIYIDL